MIIHTTRWIGVSVLTAGLVAQLSMARTGGQEESTRSQQPLTVTEALEAGRQQGILHDNQLDTLAASSTFQVVERPRDVQVEFALDGEYVSVSSQRESDTVVRATADVNGQRVTLTFDEATRMLTLAGKGVRFSGRERVALQALERRFEKHGWSPLEEGILMEQRWAFGVIALIAGAPAGVEIGTSTHKVPVQPDGAAEPQAVVPASPLDVRGIPCVVMNISTPTTIRAMPS